jgi:hypothetical protein
VNPPTRTRGVPEILVQGRTRPTGARHEITVSEGEDGDSFTAEELLLAFWRDGDPHDTDDRYEQRRVIGLLLQHGASPTDIDANGKTVAAAVSSDWIRDLLDTT